MARSIKNKPEVTKLRDIQKRIQKLKDEERHVMKRLGISPLEDRDQLTEKTIQFLYQVEMDWLNENDDRYPVIELDTRTVYGWNYNAAELSSTPLWNSEAEEREYNEETNQYEETVLDHILRKIDERAADLKDFAARCREALKNEEAD